MESDHIECSLLSPAKAPFNHHIHHDHHDDHDHHNIMIMIMIMIMMIIMTGEREQSWQACPPYPHPAFQGSLSPLSFNYFVFISHFFDV